MLLLVLQAILLFVLLRLKMWRLRFLKWLLILANLLRLDHRTILQDVQRVSLVLD